MAPPPAVSAAGRAAAYGVLLVQGNGGPQSPCVAFPLPPPRGPLGGPTPLVAEGTKYLLLAPPAKLRLRPLRSTSSPAESEDQEMPLVALGVLPEANLDDTNVAAASSAIVPPPLSFEEEFALLLQEIPTGLNCFALVGQDDVLDGIAASAQRVIAAVSELTPYLLHKETEPVPKSLVVLNSVETATAVATVRAECLEGYVRELSMLEAITKIRALPIPLPPRTAPSSEKADRLAYFVSLAQELNELAIIIEKGTAGITSK